MTSDTSRAGCPVEDYQTRGPRSEPLHYFDRFDQLQARSRPFFRTEAAGGFWVFTDHAVILEGLQHPEWFSSTVIVPEEPNPPYQWIPIMLDPPEHTKWRQVLASWFSPRRIESMKDEQRRFAAELIEAIAPRGRCDFVEELARKFPTTIFLQILGAPVEEMAQFMEWEDKILHGTPETDPDRSGAYAAMVAVQGYFRGLIEQRRSDPSSRGNDIVTAALEWTIDGRPVADDDVLSCLLLLFMAGLDTVAAQLSYTMLHLATHPDDRARIVADESLVPSAVEEMLRTYPIVQTARKATGDMEFHGCPIKQGDMVAFPLSTAGRDPEAFTDAKHFDLDRGVTRHFSFGAGPHRCLGSHLARQEMVVALEEWHRRIPHYRLDDTAPMTEHSGGVYGLDALPLEWDV